MRTLTIITMIISLFVILAPTCSQKKRQDGPVILKAENFKHHIDRFNGMEEETWVTSIPNDKAWEWMSANIPLFESPQHNFQEIYYYRWWTFRKHLKETPQGYVITEFMVDRPYADKYNMISCALGHHIYEGRWLHDSVYLDNNVHVWFRGNNGKNMERLRAFSSWTADALYNRYLVEKNAEFLVDMLPDLDAEYKAWEEERRLPNKLFWQRDVSDGMEESISGGRRVQNRRPTINSYMYANAKALSKVANIAGNDGLANKYAAKADTMKQLVLENLWNAESGFFETVLEMGEFAKAREAIGFIPWYFNLPDKDAGYEVAWTQLMDPKGFNAPFGLTTAERRHPAFRTHGCCSCEWDGAVWPFATSQTLTAMANLLNNYNQSVVSTSDYFFQLERYVESQHYRGKPYIGEYLDETTGYWLKGDQDRSRYYNHSTFNDLIITGLVGLRPRSDDVVEINPLIPQDKWDWFCLDNVKYQGNILTIVWDKTGEKYNRGKGFYVLKNGNKIASSIRLERITSEAGK